MNEISLLLAEDDLDLGNVFKQFLEINQFKVSWARDGEEALTLYHTMPHIDLVILDVMMPKLDGFSVARKMQDYPHKHPILFLTARNLKEDRLRGLQLGAVDYITKPFEADELVLKIKNLLTRQPAETDIITIGTFKFNPGELRLANDFVNYDLTEKEAELLKVLYSQRNALVKRESLLVSVWGQNDYFLGRSMDVFISRLRKYFKDDPHVTLETIRGVGIRLRVE